METPLDSESIHPAPTRRSAYLDNAKGILIILVVIGHVMSLRLTGADHTLRAMDLVVYAFHMPMFAFISGYLSRPNVFTQKGLRSVGRAIFVIALFQIAGTVSKYFLTGEFSVRTALVTPVYAAWWLWSLLTWRLMLPLFGRGKGWRAAAVSIGASLALAIIVSIVLDVGSRFSLMRTFTFLPMFLMGYWASTLNLRFPKRWFLALGAVALFVGAFFVFRNAEPFITFEWLFGRQTFAQLQTPLAIGIAKRLGLIGLSLVMGMAFLQLVPTRRSWLSVLGASSLSVYIWHALLVNAAVELKLGKALASTPLRAGIFVALMVLAFGFGPLADFTMRVIGGRRAQILHAPSDTFADVEMAVPAEG